jgi:hypothetical protein
VAARIIQRKKEMGENIVGEFHEGTKTKRQGLRSSLNVFPFIRAYTKERMTSIVFSVVDGLLDRKPALYPWFLCTNHPVYSVRTPFFLVIVQALLFKLDAERHTVDMRYCLGW